MNKKQLPLLAAAFTLALLTGCSGAKQASENHIETIGDSISEGITQTIGQTVVNLEQAVQNEASDWKDRAKAGSMSEELAASQKAEASAELSLNNAVGEIEVKPVTGDQVIVHATIWGADKSSHRDELQQIMDEAELSIDVRGSKLKVNVHPQDQPRTDLWSWAQKKIGYSDFSIDYVVEVPKSVDTFQIQSSVGEVRLTGVTGTFDIDTDVGAISLEQAVIKGRSVFESQTGGIWLDVNELDPSASVTAKTEVGSLNATLPASLDCDLNVDTELGAISGAAQGTSRLGQGGPEVALRTSVGAISIKQK